MDVPLLRGASLGSGLSLERCGKRLTGHDPVPDFIHEEMQGVIHEDFTGNQIPPKIIDLPSGYSFNITYQQIKIPDELMNTEIVSADSRKHRIDMTAPVYGPDRTPSGRFD